MTQNTFDAPTVIRTKRDGNALSDAAIDWVIEETTTEDRITVQAEKGDILRPLVICQDPEVEVSVGTWEGATFTVELDRAPAAGRLDPLDAGEPRAQA